jgi:hypothetical protein
LDLAEEVISKGIKVFSELNAHKHLTSSIGNLGLVYLSRGQLTDAFYYISKQLDDAQTLGIESEAFRAIGNRGVVRFYLGEYEAALSDLGFEQRLDYLQQFAGRELLGLTYAYLSRIYDKLGQKGRADEYSERVSAIAHDSNSLALDIIALRCAAHCQFGEEQIATLQKAVALSRGKRPMDEAGCLLFLSELEHNADERTNLWNSAKAILDQMGAQYWLQNLTPNDAVPQMPLMV